jgi:hypothetical protein
MLKISQGVSWGKLIKNTTEDRKEVKKKKEETQDEEKKDDGKMENDECPSRFFFIFVLVVHVKHLSPRGIIAKKIGNILGCIKYGLTRKYYFS